MGCYFGMLAYSVFSEVAMTFTSKVLMTLYCVTLTIYVGYPAPCVHMTTAVVISAIGTIAGVTAARAYESRSREQWLNERNLQDTILVWRVVAGHTKRVSRRERQQR